MRLLCRKYPDDRKAPAQIASWGRLIGFLLIGAGVTVMGFVAQHGSAGGNGAAASGQLASHGQAIPVYLGVIALEWALLYYCWVAVHQFGGNLKTLSGDRWTSRKDVLVDLGNRIAVPGNLGRAQRMESGGYWPVRLGLAAQRRSTACCPRA